MEWTTPSFPFSEQYTTHAELPPQTVALRDLNLGRWRSAASYETSRSNESTHEGLVDTSLEDSGMASTGAHSRDSDFDISSEDEDDGPGLDTPLQYARFHGLCYDYQLDHPLSGALIPLAQEDLSRIVDEPEGTLFHEDALFRKAFIAEVHDSLNERLDVGKEAANFLMCILRTCKQDEGDQVRVDLSDSSHKRLKLELPVLAHDHEVEMNTLRRRNEVRVTSKGIEPFQLDIEKGESFASTSAEINDKQRLDSELQNEKLDVGKETVELFRQLRDLTSRGELDHANEARKAVRISPPLLPVAPPYSPPAPAPEAMQIDLTSTPEDLIAKDAAAIEMELLDDAQATTTPTDKPLFDTEEVATAIDSYAAAPSSSSPLARKRLRNFRVEVPLTPRNHTGLTSEGEPVSKKAKKVQFDLDVASLLPNLQTESSDSLPGFAQQQINDLQDVLQRGAESVQQQLHNEKLIEIDTTMRAKVPDLEAIRIQPLWDVCSSSENDVTRVQSRRTMMHDISKELLEDVGKWSGVAKIERSLPWAPFAAYLGKVEMAEQFDDGSLERYMTDMCLDDGANDVDVWAMIARSSRPSLLPGHDSDDDEVEPTVTEADEVVDEVPGGSERTQGLPTLAPPIKKPDLLDVLRAKQNDLATSTNVPLVRSAFESSGVPRSNTDGNTALMQNDGIAQFMQLQGKATNMQAANGRASDLANNSAAKPAAQNQAPAAIMVPQAESQRGQPMSPVVIPVPETPGKSTAAIPIIASSRIMANRQLLRYIHTALPNVEMCERDAVIPASTYSSGAHVEADFTISASTGVMTTTLQKLKQRSLPGQTSTSGIRETIASTAIRYERLVVLVSEGNNLSVGDGAVVRTLDHLDCDALVDLTVWAHSLDSDVQISYVPGGEKELAGWLAAAFAQHGSIDGNMQLLQDETMWERWLRVAGLNAYAAQAVLVRLKLREDDSHDTGLSRAQKRFGVAAFVSMTAEERFERFASVLCGERVLRRVSEAIDGGWSAKHGHSKA